MDIKLKDTYYLNVIFEKKPLGILSNLYKFLFKTKYCHVHLNLDGWHNLETSIIDGTYYSSNSSNDIGYSENNEIISIPINNDEYYKLLDLTNKLDGIKYDYFALISNIFKDKYNIINKRKLICTEVVEIFLDNIDINIKNRYSVENFHNSLVKILNKKEIKYINIGGNNVFR